MQKGKFKVGVVIPAVESRIENLQRVLDSLTQSLYPIEKIVVVCDGWKPGKTTGVPVGTSFVSTTKHQPGYPQPRNVGTQVLTQLAPECNYVWFLDSDCLVTPETLQEYANAYYKVQAYDRILIGPYDWMPIGATFPVPQLLNDPRWEMFNMYEADTVHQGHLGVALGNFSGNIMWPIKEFQRVGGFWSELHAGRCEDGELGIRACAMGVPMSLASKARAYHMGHEVDLQAVEAKNSRDVPLLNARHPYVQEQGLVVADQDGKRFNFICSVCGEEINTGLIWQHEAECGEHDWQLDFSNDKHK